MNDKEYITNNRFCPIPWTGLMYNFDGTIKNCIRSSEILGNVQDSNIEDILLGESNIIKKQQMFERLPANGCSPCYVLEENNKKSFEIISDRIFYLKELKKVDKNTYTSSKNFDLQKIDIRWSNTCNFSCVYCSADYSSKWEKELGIKIKTPEQERLDQFKDYIFTNAKKLKHVYLAGGEPLLMKENLELLELLNPDVNIRVNTNLSKVETKVFEKICSFKNVHWIVSIESIEREFEYIRYGAKWSDFVDNLEILKNLEHKISFNMLHFVLNHMSIFDCIDYLKKQNFHNNSFIIGALLMPEFLNIRHLPDSVLKLVKQELQKRIDKNPGFLLENSYRNLLEYIDQPFSKNLAYTLEQISNMDLRRGLDSSKIFKGIYGN